MDTRQKLRRVFFALWPDESVRRAIRKHATPCIESLKGRVTSTPKLHVTLHFIGSVSDKELACMHEAASAVKAARFSLTLDSFGYFKRPRILWMGATEAPDPLLELHSELAKQLGSCGYEHDVRRYSPHVTLMRKCQRRPACKHDFSITWPVDSFFLVESVPDRDNPSGGVNYRIIERYPLAEISSSMR